MKKKKEAAEFELEGGLLGELCHRRKAQNTLCTQVKKNDLHAESEYHSVKPRSTHNPSACVKAKEGKKKNKKKGALFSFFLFPAFYWFVCESRTIGRVVSRWFPSLGICVVNDEVHPKVFLFFNSCLLIIAQTLFSFPLFFFFVS